MYQPFRIGRVFPNSKTKEIVLQATHDVLPESVDNKNIQIFEESSRTPLELILKVEGRNIIAELPDFPIPNTPYIIIVTNLKSVVDSPLDRMFKRTVYFKSQVTSTVTITSPTNHETVKEGVITWKETNDNPNGNIENQYYLEIATDVVFYNKILKTKIHGKQEFTIKDMKHKQYYVRVRAENDEEYGQFSQTITFISASYNEDAESIVDDGVFEGDNICDDGPIFEEELQIIDAPHDGISPKSFILKFNKDIDPEVVKYITVYRRGI